MLLLVFVLPIVLIYDYEYEYHCQVIEIKYLQLTEVFIPVWTIADRARRKLISNKTIDGLRPSPNHRVHTD